MNKKVVYLNENLRLIIRLSLYLGGIYVAIDAAVLCILATVLHVPSNHRVLLDFVMISGGAIFLVVCPLGMLWCMGMFPPRFKISNDNWGDIVVRLLEIEFEYQDLQNPLGVLEDKIVVEPTEYARLSRRYWGSIVVGSKYVLEDLAPFKEALGREVCTIIYRCANEPEIAVLKGGELVPVEVGTYYIPVYMHEKREGRSPG